MPLSRGVLLKNVRRKLTACVITMAGDAYAWERSTMIYIETAPSNRSTEDGESKPLERR
jgi:hypothetical protein